MRSKLLFVSSAASALILVAISSSSAEACCCWGGWGGQRYYAPPVNYYNVPQHMPPMAVRPMPVAPTNVSAKDNAFDPISVTVQQGTTVVWVNKGKNIHTVTSDDGKFDSGDIPPGGEFRATFVTAGTYRYHCKHHKGMVGTITVEAPKVTK